MTENEYYAGQSKKQDDASFLLLFRPLTEFQELEARWTIPGWMPEGQITLLAGDGGTGKTSTWINIAAALSSGRACILDPPGYERAPAKVLILTAEDSISKKLLKKLRVAGGTLENIIALDVGADKGGNLRRVKLGTPELERVLRCYRPALTVYDPVQGFLPPEVNMSSRNAMRDALAPLVAIGEDIGTTTLLIAHTNKRKAAFGRDRVADSADLWDISRSVIICGYTQDDGIRYLSNEKSNYAGLQETVLFSVNDDGQVVKEGCSWKHDRDYVLASQMARSAPQREATKDFILRTLADADGTMPTAELDAAVKKAGYSFASLKRAKAELKTEGAVSYFQTGSAKEKIWHIRLTVLPELAPLEDDGTPVPFEVEEVNVLAE